jgi:hypothetical protein
LYRFDALNELVLPPKKWTLLAPAMRSIAAIRGVFGGSAIAT